MSEWLPCTTLCKFMFIVLFVIDHRSEFKWNFTPEERRCFAQLMMEVADKNKDGKISVDELMLEEGYTPEQRPAIEAIFKEFDSNRDGKWDLEDLIKYMEKQGM
ncbi:hypothetical protein D915_004312 [Fasciola hepatica]|uniref:Uncharacterized protein n=1 Tax=Fasciola hepatica TaxID=6192 RepID=A0A2H1C9S8_FASHE|nr:hypothetical protein D915_004312 [Fasciola hepatica]